MIGPYGIATGLCLWMMAGLANAADVTPRVVFIAHTVLDAVPDAVPSRHWSYATVSPGTPARDDTPLRIRPVWTRAPDRHIDKMAGRVPPAAYAGFDLQLQREGVARRPGDRAAGRSLPPDDPATSLLASARMAALALRPGMLPAALRVGSHATRQDSTGDFAGLRQTSRIRSLDATVAVLDLEIAGAGLRGHGRQAVRIDDGVPLETRLYLERTTGSAGPDVQRLHVIDMATEPVLDLELEADLAQASIDSARAILDAPPFSAPSDDPAQYAPHPTPEGALESWMASADDAALETMLVVGVQRSPDGGRPHLAIGADGRAAGRSGPPIADFLSLRLRTVTLLDAAGQPLAGTDATIVQPTLPMADRQRIVDTQLAFPFQLPPDVPADTLWALDTVRMTGEVDVYRWDRAEAVRRGTSQTHNRDARIEWISPHRVALLQDHPTPAHRDGLWTTAVPIDADGHELPSAQVITGRTLDPPGDWRTPATLPPLAFESGRMPQRLDIATAKPLAGLRLRHYRWRAEPRTWTFHDIRTRMPAAERAEYERKFGRNASAR